MKRINILYWVFTGLFAALMLFSAVPNVMVTSESVKFMHDMLGYPVYFISFIGAVKILGVIAILIPGFPRLKEWAYAGLFFDLIGATYSMMSIKVDPSNLFMLVFIGMGALSYYFYRRKTDAATAHVNKSKREFAAAD